jgi:hypothetical protein
VLYWDVASTRRHGALTVMSGDKKS